MTVVSAWAAKCSEKCPPFSSASFCCRKMLSMLLLIGLGLYHLYVYKVRSRVAHIPGPPQHWFYLLGNALELLRSNKINQSQFFARYFTKYGPVFKIVVFHKVMIFTFGPEVNRQVLCNTRKFSKAQSVYRMLFSMFGTRFMGRSQVVERDIVEWRKRHRRIRHVFGSKFTNSSSPVIDSSCQSLVRLLSRTCGQQIQLNQFLSKLTLDVICRVGFGFESGALGGETPGPLENLVTHAMEGIALKTKSPFAWLTKPRQAWRIRRSIQTLRGHFASLTKQQLADGDGEDDNIHSVTVNRLQGLCDTEQLIDQAVMLVNAGQETTASLLASIFMELARQPHVLKRLANEADTVCPSGPISVEQVAQLRYTNAVVKESLRMYSPVPMVAREPADGDFEICGVVVPRGSAIYVSLLATHFLRFERPLEFLPERWLGDSPPLEPFTFGSFSFGERACAGQRLALLTTKMAIAHLVRSFNFHYPDDCNYDVVQVGSLKPLCSVRVTLQERDTADVCH